MCSSKKGHKVKYTYRKKYRNEMAAFETVSSQKSEILTFEMPAGRFSYEA